MCFNIVHMELGKALCRGGFCKLCCITSAALAYISIQHLCYGQEPGSSVASRERDDGDMEGAEATPNTGSARKHGNSLDISDLEGQPSRKCSQNRTPDKKASIMPPPSLLLAGGNLFSRLDLPEYHSLAIVPYTGDQVDPRVVGVYP